MRKLCSLSFHPVVGCFQCKRCVSVMKLHPVFHGIKLRMKISCLQSNFSVIVEKTMFPLLYIVFWMFSMQESVTVMKVPLFSLKSTFECFQRRNAFLSGFGWERQVKHLSFTWNLAQNEDLMLGVQILCNIWENFVPSHIYRVFAVFNARECFCDEFTSFSFQYTFEVFLQ